MTFADLSFGTARQAIADNDVLSWFGPLSKSLADWREHQQVSAVSNIAPPQISIRTVRGALGRSASSTNSIQSKKPISVELFDSLASFKIKTSKVAMYLDDKWRLGFFNQLDSLLGEQSWDHEDKPPTLDSFTTLLRMLLLLAPERRPGLGATAEGLLIAAWTVGSDRLTVHCLPQDRVKWVLSCELDGAHESAAGNSTLSNLREILSPYRPERWFLAKHLP